MAVLVQPPIEFTLPPDLEAHVPPEARGLARDQVRLMVTDRRTGAIVHTRFSALPEFLQAGDLVVINISATLPAALDAHRGDGRALALHLSTHLPGDVWVVEPRRTPLSPGETLFLAEGGRAAMLMPYRRSGRLWLAHLDVPAPIVEYLHRWGRPIAYPYVWGTWPLSMYQTVYAEVPGSAEMPSAGRPFTRDVLARLREKGVGIAKMVLHAGVASPERDESPYEEFFDVPVATAEAVRVARRSGGRVIAVGTTVVRALESSLDPGGDVVASRGWTDVVVTPERGVRSTDGLLTGLHEPRASHWAMLEAVAGRAVLARSYRAALEAGYLWHEFGDLQLLL
ncbi:MAG TPA: S-adenosylmethionine:tRNA ribosyltransferase-isomerase [bacterium]|nr:S-adenosylmethionine:tRNA ribosyltransferase-isomerase [bacterium]